MLLQLAVFAGGVFASTGKEGRWVKYTCSIIPKFLGAVISIPTIVYMQGTQL